MYFEKYLYIKMSELLGSCRFQIPLLNLPALTFLNHFNDLSMRLQTSYGRGVS